MKHLKKFIVIGAIGLTLAGLSTPAWAECRLSDITMKSMKAGFVDACRRTPCRYLKGVAVLTNRCTEPVGVALKMIGYDATGAPVAVQDNMWPASIQNIPPGDYPFSLDHWLDYDADITTFELRPMAVKQWR